MGVRIGTIRRAFDEFLLNKARSAIAYSESTSAFASAASQIENILLPGDANLGNAIGRFFEGLQEIASDPADLIGRNRGHRAGEAGLGQFQAAPFIA